MGWGQLLNFECDRIYRRVVIQWMASLTKNGDELTGVVDGKSYTITPIVIRDFLGVDTRTDLPYVRFKDTDYQAKTDENKSRRNKAYMTVFGINKDWNILNQDVPELKMTPLANTLWQVWTLMLGHPLVDCLKTLQDREIHLLHALYTGDYLYSFSHLMIDDIWDMYENTHQRTIPHGSYISEILNRLGAVSNDECAEMIAPQDRLISRESFVFLMFSESPTEYIIDDLVKKKRDTFPKKVNTQPPPQIPQPPSSYIPTQMPAPNSQVDMTMLLTNLQRLTDKNSELMATVSNIQKQMEHQEKRAEIRAHAIIWDIERQRYYYEQEQEQLRMAYNQVNGVNGVDEFKFPEISRTSFHPLQQGSPYYDPTQGDDIPKAFQSLFDDTYGPRR